MQFLGRVFMQVYAVSRSCFYAGSAVSRSCFYAGLCSFEVEFCAVSVCYQAGFEAVVCRLAQCLMYWGALRSTVHCTVNLHYIYGSLIGFLYYF